VKVDLPYDGMGQDHVISASPRFIFVRPRSHTQMSANITAHALLPRPVRLFRCTRGDEMSSVGWVMETWRLAPTLPWSRRLWGHRWSRLAAGSLTRPS